MKRSKLLYGFLFFLSVAFLINIGTLVLIHEEPRRGIITFEMLKSHNFLQPTVLGEPYYRKPPFHNWLLALFSLLFGGVKELSLRLPSAVAVLLTGLLIFLTGRRLTGEREALAGALIYTTFFVVLIGYGTKCEPDTLFGLLAGGAPLVWFYLMREKRELPAWIAGYLMTGLALLTKGLPALQFFWAFLISYGLVTGRWKELLSLKHLSGALTGLSPFFLWLLEVRSTVAAKTLMSEVLSRAPGEIPLLKTLKNYLTFPLRLIAATIPWSLILIYYGVKKKIKLPRGEAERVLLGAFILDALIYWLFPGSRLRYLIPALPLLALLSGKLLYSQVIIHKRAKEIIRFTSQLAVPVGIVAGILATANPSLILKETVIFIGFLYGVYFFLAPRFEITRVVFLWALLMLVVRGFYSSYFYPVAQYRYPPVREVAEQIARDTEGFNLYTKTRYLQLCFYVERDRDRILRFNPHPPADSLFLSQKREGFTLKEYSLGKHRFYLCSYGIKSLPGRRQSQEEPGRQKPGKQSHSKEKGESPQG